MKTFEHEEADLGRCVKEANSASVLVVKNGKPVALVSDVRGLDAEQIELGTNARLRRGTTLSLKQIVACVHLAMSKTANAKLHGYMRGAAPKAFGAQAPLAI